MASSASFISSNKKNTPNGLNNEGNLLSHITRALEGRWGIKEGDVVTMVCPAALLRIVDAW